ncbi:MAG TPA: acetate/propionate family kinase, partial [Kribbellaceae bacterium]
TVPTSPSTARTCPRSATGDGVPDVLLVVNPGSSSLKLRVLDPGDAVVSERDVTDWHGEPAALDDFLRAAGGGTDAVAVRVVHGGGYGGAVRVDDDVERQLEQLVPLAPLHQPRALDLVRHLRKLLPKAPIFACFDTSFHSTLPPESSTYALPAQWRDRWGLRRYGFHGLSHAYAARRTAVLLDRDDLRVVTCHLGAGASVCAVERGRSVDTSMGFTPVEGLVMATRSGSVDPGLLMWLLTEGGLGADELSDALEHRSGLLGLSETSGDLREVLAARDGGDARAGLAFAVYAHRLTGEIARMAAALGGADAIVFTGGAGEHSPQVRRAACERLGWLGVRLDDERNTVPSRPDAVISRVSSPVEVCVVAAREDLEMARQTRALLSPR